MSEVVEGKFPIDDFTEQEMEDLADVALHNPEIRERNLSYLYLLWGRYLVDHGIVSEFPKETHEGTD
jgi:hypothetical protein